MNRTPEDETVVQAGHSAFFFEIGSGPFFSPYFKKKERRRLKTKIIELTSAVFSGEENAKRQWS